MNDKSCHYHLGATPVSYCFKYDRGLCVDCLRCEDPDNDCKYRQGCMVWEMIRLEILPRPTPRAEGDGRSTGVGR